MKIVYKDLVSLLSLWLMGWACSQPQHTQSQADTTFRGDPQHTGVYATKAVHKFKAIKWAHQTNGPVRSSPAVTNDAVYFGSGDGYLHAVDIQRGEEKWRCKTEGAVHSSPAVANGVVYFTSRDGCLYAVEAQSGKQLLKFQTGEPLPYKWGFDYYISSPLVVNGVVYFGSEDGHLYGLDIRSGKPRWKFNAQSRAQFSGHG